MSISTNSDPDLGSTEHTRTGLSVESLKHSFEENLFFQLGKFRRVATRNDDYMALAYTVRDRLLDRWVRSAQAYLDQKSRTICYLSAEFLMGPQLGNNILNLGIQQEVGLAMKALGLDLDTLLEHEVEPGLGNGGLGRLAACFLDSLATLRIPCIGYGIRYEYGIFEQAIRDGWQIERTDKWLQFGNPWEIARPEIGMEVKFGGRTLHEYDSQGKLVVKWVPDWIVRGIAHDIPVLGYRVDNANLLRLWKAEACESFDFQAFNVGNYYRAVDAKIQSENITKILYPNDEGTKGKELRLQQQYFFVSCALQDMIRIFKQVNLNLCEFHEKYTVQLNDTHPAIGIAELMRLLLDENQLPWDQAWNITRNTFGYTNHTLLPEALETWSQDLFQRLLPRHLEIIQEINRRFLNDIRLRFPDDEPRVQRMTIISDGPDQRIRMANLACVGSYSINGVSQLHSDLLRDGVLKDFHDVMPEKFHNVTNGVTPRRFLALSNPELTELFNRHLKDEWLTRMDELRELEPLAEDSGFQREWEAIKLRNKVRLAHRIREKTGITVDPRSLFDIQMKRIHEYKRQHLNLLQIVGHYLQLKDNPNAEIPSRTYLFGGKAAPGYVQAKLIIKLINEVAEWINNDPLVQDRLKVVFLPNFNVKQAQDVYPAADLSEQISTAGKEASGTGNMKFSMNGALTIGTLDGANVEIRERVGEENFFLFGLTAREVQQLRSDGYCPWEYSQRHELLQRVLHALDCGLFSRGDCELSRPLIRSLMEHDHYMLLADFPSYVDAQNRVSEAWQNRERWNRMSILNSLRMGYFSSDRSIRDYAEQIWKVKPTSIKMGAFE